MPLLTALGAGPADRPPPRVIAKYIHSMNLQKICKAFCGAPLQRPQIFEAAQSMPCHPDKICPVQVLHICPV